MPPPFAGKEVSPIGGGVSASVYADPVGQWLLRGAVGPVDPQATALKWDGRVLVVEGGPAWLRYASAADRVTPDGETHAVLGVWSGAWVDDRWGRDIARRLVGASSVVVAGDHDDGGERIAAPIVAACQAVGVRVRMANRRDG